MSPKNDARLSLPRPLLRSQADGHALSTAKRRTPMVLCHRRHVKIKLAHLITIDAKELKPAK